MHNRENGIELPKDVCGQACSSGGETMGINNQPLGDHGCRFNLPLAVVHQTRTYEHGIQNFREKDPTAAEMYLAMLEDIQMSGMSIESNEEVGGHQGGSASYRAPIGKRALKRIEKIREYIPWCGELRIEGSSDENSAVSTDWRAYFFDLRNAGQPNVEIDDVLLASVEGKRRQSPRLGRSLGRVRPQDGHIVKAMDKAFEWCHKDHPEYELRRLQ